MVALGMSGHVHIWFIMKVKPPAYPQVGLPYS
jgi:hypothetical protein